MDPIINAPVTSSLGRLKLSLGARLAIIVVVACCEKSLLNVFVDFDRAQAAEGLGAAVRVAQHWGLRCMAAFAAALALFAYVYGTQRLRSIDAAAKTARFDSRWLLVHLLCAAGIPFLIRVLYQPGAPLPLQMLVIAGLVLLTVGAAASAALTMAPGPLWLVATRALGIVWGYAAAAALLSTGVMQLSQRLWGPTASLTFELVRRLLYPLLPTLHADATTRVLSTSRFAVEVSEICSGLEGMGLMLAFTGAWLVFFRREYIFPRALVLIPLGLVAIFCLNVLRIAALVLIGNAGFPEVAQYGFHSQAGWIAFIFAACGIALYSRRSHWLFRAAAQTATCKATSSVTANATIAATDGVSNGGAAAYLVPLLAILAAGVLSHAMSGRFEIFYPLRLIAGLSALFIHRRRLLALDFRCSWRGPALGLVVSLLWIVCAHFSLPHTSMPASLLALPDGMRAFWLACRVISPILTVPLAEELAYRGYLMRRLTRADFETLPYRLVHWPALIASAVLFGLGHGALWIAGIVAGLAYGYLAKRRNGLGDAVAAHATSNALIAIAVLEFGQWQLW